MLSKAHNALVLILVDDVLGLEVSEDTTVLEI